jgi:hypothetical protein
VIQGLYWRSGSKGKVLAGKARHLHVALWLAGPPRLQPYWWLPGAPLAGMANRMLICAYKRFKRRVPEPGTPDDEDRGLLEKVLAGFETVGDLYNACRFRAALGEAMALAGEANVYLDH